MVIASSIPFRFSPTHEIIKQVDCFSCHTTELKDLQMGEHIRRMSTGQAKVLYDYLALYGNNSDNLSTLYSLEGPCYSCHITYNKFNLFGLTDPLIINRMENGTNIVDAQYGYIIKWPEENNFTSINGSNNNNNNASIHIELEVQSVSPSNFSVDSTIKIMMANYSGGQNNTSYDYSQTLNQGENQVIDVSNINDYFSVILILDGLWNGTVVNLRINGTDKGSESFLISANNNKPFVLQLPFSSNGVYYFKTNGTYRAVRLDYVWEEWKNYPLDKITSSELINVSRGSTWNSGYTCGSPDGMCHIIQKTTAMGLSDGMNPSKSLYSHNMEFVTSTQCKLCHLKNSPIGLGGVGGTGGDCIGCHQTQQGLYPAIDTASFSTHANINKADGINTVSNSDCQTCHYDTSNMMQSGFTVATRTCTDCHISGLNSAPIVSNHIPGGLGISTVVYCSTCHNNMVNGSTYSDNASISHYGNYITDISTVPYQHLALNSSNCIECHNGQYTDNVSWGSPVNISTSSKRQHNETQTNQCDICHNDGKVQSLALVDFHNASVTSVSGGGPGLNCIECHANIASSYFGKHTNIDTIGGSGILNNNDCMGCHFDINMNNMQNGYANINNTYFCQDCHTSSGRNPGQYANITNTTLRKIDMPPGHAQNKCEQCHFVGNSEPRPLPAEYQYHGHGPSGTASGKNCFSCHYRSDGIGSGGANIGLLDKPFNAPGEAHYCLLCHGNLNPTLISSTGRPTSCSMCHSSNDNHNVNIGNHHGEKTIITNLIMTSPVNTGTIAIVNTTVTSDLTQIAKAQYRIHDSSNNIIIDWTEMNATDGKFDDRIEQVTGYIDTTGLLGNYSVLVRGMSSAATGAPAGGINHDTTKPYYPDNAVWTDVKVTSLVVQ